jgi:hypothetical protein
MKELTDSIKRPNMRITGIEEKRCKQKTESQNLKMKWKLKEKLKNYYSNNSKPVKQICKNSPTPSKD